MNGILLVLALFVLSVVLVFGWCWIRRNHLGTLHYSADDNAPPFCEPEKDWARYLQDKCDDQSDAERDEVIVWGTWDYYRRERSRWAITRIENWGDLHSIRSRQIF